MLTRKLPRHPEPIFLNLGGRTPRQSRHLPRMRRNHEHSTLSIQLIRESLECIQPVGVENNRNLGLAHQSPHQFGSLDMSRNPWPDRQHALSPD